MGDTNETNADNVLDTETQSIEDAAQGAREALGEGGIKALQAEREARKQADNARKEIEAKLAAATAEIERFQAGERTELENAQHQATRAAELAAEVEKRAQAAEAALMRYEVAQEKGITGDALELLNGTTREELEAKADSILKIIEASKAANNHNSLVVKTEGDLPSNASGPEQDFANAMRAFL